MSDICKVSGNPCGTDTWEVTTPCLCRPCQRWVSVRWRAAEDEVEKLRAQVTAQQAEFWRLTEVANARAQQLAEQEAVLEAHDDAIREALDFIHDDPGERPGKAARILNRVLEKHAGDAPGADALAARVLEERADAGTQGYEKGWAEGVDIETRSLRTERDALAADNARLREAHKKALECWPGDEGFDVLDDALAAAETAETAAAWLAERDARVLEEFADLLNIIDRDVDLRDLHEASEWWDELHEASEALRARTADGGGDE